MGVPPAGQEEPGQGVEVAELLAQARAAGCQVNEAGPSDAAESLLTCTTSGRGVVFVLDGSGSFPVTGSTGMT